MIERRRSRGFESLGALSARDLGLRSRDARRLSVEHAWRAVAGETTARRLRAVRVYRGTLEIEADPRWAEVTRALVTRLAGALAARDPRLGIRRVRIRVEGGEDPPETWPVTPAPIGSPAPDVPPRSNPPEPAAPHGDAETRLRRAAARYLGHHRRHSR